MEVTVGEGVAVGEGVRDSVRVGGGLTLCPSGGSGDGCLAVGAGEWIALHAARAAANTAGTDMRGNIPLVFSIIRVLYFLPSPLTPSVCRRPTNRISAWDAR